MGIREICQYSDASESESDGEDSKMPDKEPEVKEPKKEEIRKKEPQILERTKLEASNPFFMSQIVPTKKTEKAARTVGTQTNIPKVSNFGPVYNAGKLPIFYEKQDDQDNDLPSDSENTI